MVRSRFWRETLEVLGCHAVIRSRLSFVKVCPLKVLGSREGPLRVLGATAF